MIFKKENGVTMTMLVITIIVMLIIAVVLIDATIGNNSLLKNSKETKFKEEIISIRTRYYEKITLKEEIEGVDQSELDHTELENELEKILKEHPKYSQNHFGVNLTTNDLVYKKGEFSKEEEKILEELNIAKSN